jgi:hypothetical protein
MEHTTKHPLAAPVESVRDSMGEIYPAEYLDLDAVEVLLKHAERTIKEDSTTPPPFARELLTGLVEPGTDDARCVRCKAQAILYVLDVESWQWFTCLDHHGIVMAELLRGKHDGVQPPLPPLS